MLLSAAQVTIAMSLAAGNRVSRSGPENTNLTTPSRVAELHCGYLQLICRAELLLSNHRTLLLPGQPIDTRRRNKLSS